MQTTNTNLSSHLLFTYRCSFDFIILNIAERSFDILKKTIRVFSVDNPNSVLFMMILFLFIFYHKDSRQYKDSRVQDPTQSKNSNHNYDYCGYSQHKLHEDYLFLLNDLFVYNMVDLNKNISLLNSSFKFL
jgi:hypothetical protein